VPRLCSVGSVAPRPTERTEQDPESVGSVGATSSWQLILLIHAKRVLAFPSPGNPCTGLSLRSLRCCHLAPWHFLSAKYSTIDALQLTGVKRRNHSYQYSAGKGLGTGYRELGTIIRRTSSPRHTFNWSWIHSGF